MLFNKYWIEEDINKLHEIDLEEFDTTPLCNRPEHERFAERVRKSLYYGKLPDEDRPSLPMTELAVNYIRDAAPKELGKIDMYLASDIGRRAYVSPCSMMLGMIYIERIKHKNPDYLNHVSSSELFLISMMMASKFLYDEGTDEEVYNDEWAEASNLDTSEVNELEINFLRAIDWTLFVDEDEFENVLARMEQMTALSQGRERGFWTYGDLVNLFNTKELWYLFGMTVKEMNKVILVCSLAYAACAFTMVAAVYVSTAIQRSEGLTTLVNTLRASEEPVIIVRPHDSMATHTSDFSPEVAIRSSERNFNEGASWNIGASNFIPQSNENSDKKLKTKTSEFGLSGFLAFTLIRDTVANFLVALKGDDDLKTDLSSDAFRKSGEDSSLITCSCPDCPIKANLRNSFTTKKCLRNSLMVPPLSLWSSLVLNRTASEALFCKCVDYSTNGKLELSIKPADNTPISRTEYSDLSKQLRYLKQPFNLHTLGYQLSSKVAIDILPGFHTNQPSRTVI